jgi:hypothetical protein
MYDSVGVVNTDFRENSTEISGGEDLGVKGGVVWRSSRPLTPESSPSQLAWVESQVLSEIQPIVENPSCFLHPRPKPVTLNRSFFDGNPTGSINHVFGPVPLHDFLFKLPQKSREAGRPIRRSA